MNISREFWLLIGTSLLVVVAAMLLPPIAQSDAYHQFADRRNFLGIPNFNDVLSNLAFIVSGSIGLVFLLRLYQKTTQRSFHHFSECLPYGVLFLSIAAAGLGSMYYHWTPDNDHLLWDRLPISISMTALLAATLVDRVDPKIGLWSLPPLVAWGIFSVLVWHWTERQGAGNLNYYVVTQFYSILLIIWISLRFPSRYSRGNDIFYVIAWYGLAKVVEMLDASIFSWTQGWISGHTLKHLIAAYAAYWIVRMLRKRVFLVL